MNNLALDCTLSNSVVCLCKGYPLPNSILFFYACILLTYEVHARKKECPFKRGAWF